MDAPYVLLPTPRGFVCPTFQAQTSIVPSPCNRKANGHAAPVPKSLAAPLSPNSVQFGLRYIYVEIAVLSQKVFG